MGEARTEMSSSFRGVDMTAKWKGTIQRKNEGSSKGSAVLGRVVVRGIRESKG
jgi:hypothetical protein